jgi:hypothetical protein
MENRLFGLGRLTLLAGCAVVINGASGAYLPKLGPSPLRFSAPPSFTPTVAMLPPLRMDDSALLTNAAILNLATNVPPAENVEPFGPPPPAESINIGATNATAQTLSAQPPVVLDPTQRITPQMLVDFFKPVLDGTNAAPVTAPYGSFTPPQWVPPSSSATYRSK